MPVKPCNGFSFPVTGIGKYNRKKIIVGFQPLVGSLVFINGAVERSQVGIPVGHQPGKSFFTPLYRIGKRCKLRVTIFQQPVGNRFIPEKSLTESNKDLCRVIEQVLHCKGLLVNSHFNPSFPHFRCNFFKLKDSNFFRSCAGVARAME